MIQQLVDETKEDGTIPQDTLHRSRMGTKCQ